MSLVLYPSLLGILFHLLTTEDHLDTTLTPSGINKAVDKMGCSAWNSMDLLIDICFVLITMASRTLPMYVVVKILSCTFSSDDFP